MEFQSGYYGSGLLNLNYRGVEGIGLTKQRLGSWKEGVICEGGGSNSPVGFCDREDDIGRSDTPSSTSSSSISAASEEDDDYMEEVSAASQHLEQLREQALKLLDDMEAEQKYQDLQNQRGKLMLRIHRQSENHHGHRNNTNGGRGKRRLSSRSSSQSSATTYKLRLRKSDQNYQFENVYQNLQSQSQSIMDIARQTLESIQQDSYTQYAQKKIRAALKHPASNQYMSTNQQRFRKEQLIMLQQQYQQQRRQLRRARKMSGKYNRASTFSGSLSPIPEVHTDGSYYD